MASTEATIPSPGSKSPTDTTTVADEKPPFRLMELPPEIRNIIWQFVLTPDNRVIAIDVEATENHIDPEQSGSDASDASEDEDIFDLPDKVMYPNTGRATYPDPTARGRWSIVINPRWSFDGILACKQIFREARGFLAGKGFVLDIKNTTNRPIPIEAILPSRHYRNSLSAVFFEFPDQQHMQLDIPGSEPRFFLLETIMALPSLTAIAFRRAVGEWPKIKTLGHWLDLEVFMRKRQYESQSSVLSLCYEEYNIDDDHSVDIDVYFHRRPGVQLFMECDLLGAVGCGGTCSSWNKSVAALRARGVTGEIRYRPCNFCLCRAGSQVRRCVAVRKPVLPDGMAWTFLDHMDGREVDTLDKKVFRWLGDR